MTGSRVVGVMLDPRQQSLESDLRSAGLPEFEVVSAEGLTAEFLPPDALPQYERKARAGNSIISAPYT